MPIANAKLNKNDVVDVYTQTAPVYDVWGSLTETKARKRSLMLARIRDGESILEVAIVQAEADAVEVGQALRRSVEWLLKALNGTRRSIQDMKPYVSEGTLCKLN